MSEVRSLLRLRGAVRALLDQLPPAQRGVVHRPFADEAVRRDWTYLPGPRDGLALADMDRAGAAAAHAVIAAALSTQAFAQVTTIMGLEDVLDDLEQGRRSRHRGDYWTLVFGDPAGEAPWAWRFEGHHVSLHVTVVGDEVRSAPLFLGANPARVGHGGLDVVEPLGAEERAGFALLDALDPEAAATAVIDEEAPSDIVSAQSPRLDRPLEPPGLRLDDLADASAADAARVLLDVYLDRVPAGLAGDRALLDGIHFAWAGGRRPGTPHYYRLQGPRLLIELDNTQNDANHVHTVCRDPLADFGEDLLAAHHRAEHGRG